MQPSEFWACTAHDFELLCRGARWREERMRDRMAWVVAHVLAAWGGEKAPSMVDLLGRQAGQSDTPGYH